MRALKIVGLLCWAFLVLAITIYHRGVFIPPVAPALNASASSEWLDRSEHHIHQLVLRGGDYDRGVASGKATQHLLLQQEKELMAQIEKVMPTAALRRLFILGLIRWYWGISPYFEKEHLEEMLGVSLSVSPEFNYLADPFTRQVGYHGVHEVGQMMVDNDFGCTLLAAPTRGGWVIGRNFDFEGGDVFDREKILKWVFPVKGHAYVSIIWAGMVGAVTGVNEKGVFISINAAGSSEIARYGTPSTLVLLKALQYADTAQEAVDILRQERMWITDTFVVGQSGSPLLRVEKSAERTEVLTETAPVAVTNHLSSPAFRDDSVNVKRQRQLSTLARQQSGERRLKAIRWEKLAARERSLEMLSALRDRSMPDGTPLPLGNRAAIDALIATHAVVWDSVGGLLFVGRGPALTGAFSAYDLPASFKAKRPVTKGELPADPQVSGDRRLQIKTAISLAENASKKASKGQCAEGRELLKQSLEFYADPFLHDRILTAQGDLEKCEGKSGAEFWKKALAHHPAYEKQRLALEKKVAEASK